MGPRSGRKKILNDGPRFVKGFQGLSLADFLLLLTTKRWRTIPY